MKWKFIDTDSRACFTFSVDAPNPQLYCTHPLNIIICAFAFCNFRHLANPQNENSMQMFQSLSTPTYSTEKTNPGTSKKGRTQQTQRTM